MPFDDAGFLTPRHDPTIQRIREILGPNGEKWLTGAYRTTDGRRCVIGALADVLQVTTPNSVRLREHPVFVAMERYATLRYRVGTPQGLNDNCGWTAVVRMLDAAEKEVLSHAVR